MLQNAVHGVLQLAEPGHGSGLGFAASGMELPDARRAIVARGAAAAAVTRART
jgi:hypothetical protein